jgi:hypothetical protein
LITVSPAATRSVRPAHSSREPACTRAAEEMAAEVVGQWGGVLGAAEVRALWAASARIAPQGPIRPAW